jgi:anaerobic ribonucleoside-triphosphate reductase activating protein
MLIHSYSISRVNGPGKRFVLWTQGCSKACKNCYNPETWKFEGEEMSPEKILELIENFEVDGITLTGGDPLEQSDILELLRLLYNLNLPRGIILFTGYKIDEINNSSMRDCLNYIDVLIDGRYEDNLRISSGLKGSSNQNIFYFSSKIKEDELLFDQEVEININNKEIYLTGFPVNDRKFLKDLGVILK